VTKKHRRKVADDNEHEQKENISSYLYGNSVFRFEEKLEDVKNPQSWSCVVVYSGRRWNVPELLECWFPHSMTAGFISRPVTSADAGF